MKLALKDKIKENSSNVSFKLKTTNFKFRVAGVVRHKKKILLVKMNDNSFFCLPGGRVKMKEDSRAAIFRELREELPFETHIKKLLFINENFYTKNKEDFHEICFYFQAAPSQKNFKAENLFYEEKDEGEVVKHQFVWATKKELKDLEFQPKNIRARLFKTEEKHLITRGC